MQFSVAYREKLLSTIAAVDTVLVEQAIDWMRQARQENRAIFVAGNGGSAATAAHFVCDMVKGASVGQSSRFRIISLGQNLQTLTAYSNDLSYADALVEEMKNFAQAAEAS